MFIQRIGAAVLILGLVLLGLALPATIDLIGGKGAGGWFILGIIATVMFRKAAATLSPRPAVGAQTKED